MGRKVRYDTLIKDDVDKIVARANFTDEQNAVFEELCKGRLYDAGIWLKLNMGQTKYYEVKKKVEDKVTRILL